MRGELAERPGREGGVKRVLVTMQAARRRPGWIERNVGGSKTDRQGRVAESAALGWSCLWCLGSFVVFGFGVAAMEIVCCRLPVVFLFLVGGNLVGCE